jgi:hypothetical protein
MFRLGKAIKKVQLLTSESAIKTFRDVSPVIAELRDVSLLTFRLHLQYNLEEAIRILHNMKRDCIVDTTLQLYRENLLTDLYIS